jgi:hypothetical protein
MVERTDESVFTPGPSRGQDSDRLTWPEVRAQLERQDPGAAPPEAAREPAAAQHCAKAAADQAGEQDSETLKARWLALRGTPNWTPEADTAAAIAYVRSATWRPGAEWAGGREGRLPEGHADLEAGA